MIKEKYYAVCILCIKDQYKYSTKLCFIFTVQPYWGIRILFSSAFCVYSLFHFLLSSIQKPKIILYILRFFQWIGLHISYFWQDCLVACRDSSGQIYMNKNNKYLSTLDSVKIIFSIHYQYWIVLYIVSGNLCTAERWLVHVLPEWFTESSFHQSWLSWLHCVFNLYFVWVISEVLCMVAALCNAWYEWVWH